MEQKNKGRMRFKIAVFVVLGLHGVAVLALLMQGCKDRSAESGQPSTSASEPRPNRVLLHVQFPAVVGCHQYRHSG